MDSNPFFYGGAVKEEFFCNRKNELMELKNDIAQGLNILIFAPRRFGKTSLIFKALNGLEDEKNIEYIFLDLFTISSKEEFINKYFNEIAKTLHSRAEKIVKFFKNIVNLRPNINVTFDAQGNPKFSLNLIGEDIDKTLEDVFNSPLKLIKDKKLVVVFDEFQQINNFQLENQLRSIIQLHSNKISYIFMGSKKSILQQMFFDKNRAFYKSVKYFKIGSIEKNEWKSFITVRFHKTQKEISEDVIDKLLDITKGFPYYTQQFAYEIWNLTEKEATLEIFEKALRIALEKVEDIFMVEFDNLTLNQRKALKVVLEKDGENLYDEIVLAKQKIKLSSFQTALKALIQKDILDKLKDRYYFQDPLFEYWLKQRL